MASPAVHPAESLEDALKMFDSHIPLTFREKKLILQSLYDLAFREGAKQGRQAGVEHAQTEARDILDRAEYTDPTTAIRRNLEDKQRAVAELSKHTKPFDFKA